MDDASSVAPGLEGVSLQCYSESVMLVIIRRLYFVIKAKKYGLEVTTWGKYATKNAERQNDYLQIKPKSSSVYRSIL